MVEQVLVEQKLHQVHRKTARPAKEIYNEVDISRGLLIQHNPVKFRSSLCGSEALP